MTLVGLWGDFGRVWGDFGRLVIPSLAFPRLPQASPGSPTLWGKDLEPELIELMHCMH